MDVLPKTPSSINVLENKRTTNAVLRAGRYSPWMVLLFQWNWIIFTLAQSENLWSFFILKKTSLA